MPGASIGHHESHDENTKIGGFNNQTLMIWKGPTSYVCWPPPVPMNMNETQVKVYANIDRLTIGHPISPIFTDSPHAYNTMLPSRNQTWQWKSLHS